MADQPRTQTNNLAALNEMEREPYRYALFSAIRLLDTVFRDSPRTGSANRPSNESFRIGQEPTLKFAPASIASFQRRPFDQTWQLKSYFFGLCGPNGALPLHITEYVHQRIQHNRDTTIAGFLNLFHHRLAGFFYRAWAEGQPVVHLDRPETDQFAKYVGALCGLGLPSQVDRDAMPHHAKLFFCAQLASNARHADGLQSILAAFFGSQASIVTFVSHWIQLPDDCRWSLGRSDTAGQLGVSTTIGSRVRDCQQRFCIVLGPMEYKKFIQLLPPGESLKRLKAIVDQYVGFQFSWVVQLVLKADHVKPMRLGRQGNLGWTTWLASRPPKRDADQLVIDPDRQRRSRTAFVPG